MDEVCTMIVETVSVHDVFTGSNMLRPLSEAFPVILFTQRNVKAMGFLFGSFSVCFRGCSVSVLDIFAFWGALLSSPSSFWMLS